MKLTEKDQEFLESLKVLMDEKELTIDLKEDGVKRMVLRGNYGSRIELSFGMSRQGVRWRFQRLFNEIYVNAYLTIFWIESHFGTELRSQAITVARDHVELRRKVKQAGQLSTGRR